MKVLVVEDHAQLRQELCTSLLDWRHVVAAAATGAEALRVWASMQPELVLLDLGLPDLDGMRVLEQGRRLGAPPAVLILSARATIGDRVIGLNAGADDYMLKPVDLRELRTRMEVLERRHRPAGAPGATPQAREPVWWDEGARAFRCAHKTLALTPRESALLQALAAQPNRAVRRDVLVGHVFRGIAVNDEALEVVACRLRRKLAGSGATIVTLRGLGYLMKTQPPRP